MIYFDYASSTPVDNEVLVSYNKLLSNYFANSSGIHKLGVASNELLEKARINIANILKVKSSEVIFTSGATESNNIAIKGVALKYQTLGKHLITSNVEHPSVLNVFKQLEEQFGFEVDYVNVNEEGKVTIEELKKHLRKDTILVSLMWVNNESGSINDIEYIGKYIKENNPKTFFHVDGTQGFGKLNINFDYIDLFSMSAHKIYGLKGSGLLIKKDHVNLHVLINGGGQEFGLRSGTSNFPLDCMLAKTIRLNYEDMDTNFKHVKLLSDKFRKCIQNIDGILINSPSDASPYIINISILDKKSAIVLKYLEDKDIIVSATSACGAKKNPYSYVIEAMYPNLNRSNCAIRISLSKFNNESEIDTLVNELKTIRENIK